MKPITSPCNNGHRLKEAYLWQAFILVLTIYVLIALLVESAFTLSVEMSRLLYLLDTLICFVFITDFFVAVMKSSNRRIYLKWAWIDLVGSIPFVHWLRVARVARMVRIIRILRAVRSFKVLTTLAFRNRGKGTLAVVTMVTFALMIAASIAILNVETTPDANITRAGDALWWSFVTIATVGYGEYHPVTTAGRIIAAILMTAGIGLFGTFTAYLASTFITPKNPVGVGSDCRPQADRP